MRLRPYFSIWLTVLVMLLLIAVPGVYSQEGYPIELISRAADSTLNFPSDYPSVSANGRFVAFSSVSDLVSDDTNFAEDVFVVDRETGTIELISRAADGNPGNSFSISPSVSADGRFVAFQSSASNLVSGDTNNTMDVFVVDRATDTIELVSRTSEGFLSNAFSSMASISADGRFVAFVSGASNLVPNDTNGQHVVFVVDRQTNIIELVSRANDGSLGNDRTFRPSISADGRFVTFASSASNLVSNDTNGQHDVFVVDRATDTIELISRARNGSMDNGSVGDPSISADGRFVAFGSSSNLVPGDTNGQHDIFVVDREKDTIKLVSWARGGALSNGFSYRARISADGRFVAFASLASNLVPGDINGAGDIFLVDRRSQIELEIIDPVPTLTAGIRQPEHYRPLLATLGEARTGAVTDGETRLLLRAKVSSGDGTVEFCQPSGDIIADGGVGSLGGELIGRSECVSVTPVEVDGEYYAFALYQVPDDFVIRDTHIHDVTRPVALEATFVPTSGDTVTTGKSIDLERPRVVLVHGLWSDGKAWDEFGLRNDDRFHDPYVVNYRSSNADAFSSNVNILADPMQNVRKE